MRAVSIPESINSLRMSSFSVEGPSVQIIFVFLIILTPFEFSIIFIIVPPIFHRRIFYPLLWNKGSLYLHP